MSKLTVSIVTYQPDRALLARTVSSLAESARQARSAGALSSATLFLIDNGPASSHDALCAAACSWPSELGPAEIVTGHGNVGYGRGNNLVLGRLESDFHLVLNPDVELDRDALTASLATMREHSDVGIVAPAVFGEDGARQYLCKRYPSVWVLFLRGFAQGFVRRRFERAIAEYEMRDVIGDRFVKGVPLASGCFLFVRTSLFARLGGFDPRFFMYFEDYDLSVRVSREAQVAYAPTVSIVHHGGEAARKGWRHIAWFAQSAGRFFSTYGWKLF